MMNENLLRAIYKRGRFADRNIPYEKFAEDMEDENMQQAVYNKFKFADKGKSFEEFQGELLDVPEKQPAPAPEHEPTEVPTEEAQTEQPESQENEIPMAGLTIAGPGMVFNLGFLEGTKVGDFIGDVTRAAGRGLAQGAGVSESLEVLSKGQEATNEDLTDLVNVVQNQEKYGMSDEMRAFQEAEGGKASWQAFIKAPLTIITETVVESAAAMGRSGGVAIAASAATGPAATVLTPIAMGATSAALETSGKMVEGIQEYMAENDMEFNAENIAKVIDDQEAWSEIRRKAITKGAIIGLVDGASAGLVSKIGGAGIISKATQQAGKKAGDAASVATKAVKGGTSKGTKALQTGIEVSAGSGGELLGQTAIGEDLDFKAAIMEAIGEIPGAATSIASSTIINERRKGTLTDKNMAQAVIDNSQQDFNTAVDVAEGLRQINPEQAQQLKNSFDELKTLNDTIPENISNRKKRGEILAKIKERKNVDAEITQKQTQEVDESFQDQRDDQVAALEERRNEINEDIEILKKDAEKTGPVRKEGVTQEGQQVSVGDMPSQPQQTTQQTQTTQQQAQPTQTQVAQQKAPEVGSGFRYLKNPRLLKKDVNLNITNAKTGKVEQVTMTAAKAQSNIQTQLAKLKKLRTCL